jgi:hypothetical protein
MLTGERVSSWETDAIPGRNKDIYTYAIRQASGARVVLIVNYSQTEDLYVKAQLTGFTTAPVSRYDLSSASPSGKVQQVAADKLIRILIPKNSITILSQP